ncbi:cyclin-A1 [Stegastes partitus]|uniref:G2/mitotic-specific cyclin-B2 n=1 Tax=Stegastes partitus TaxID=144197 RepID=A0A9Y4JRH5_9TELE|nr:PREDICTED: cyclin-A1 [Stegastes partitus]
MMNFSTNASVGSHTGKENVPSSTRVDALQVQRTKQRTVLSVLSENEQRGRSLSQGSKLSKHSSVSDSSQLNFLGCPSSSSYDIYVEEACEVVLAASGEELDLDSYCLHAETDALQNEDMRLLLELSSCSCQDASMQSEPNGSLLSEEVLCLEYAENIYQHLRERETKLSARPDYLARHPEITDSMRAVLVEWLVEVSQEYKLHSETLHLAVNYMDRFLSCTGYVKRVKLQLVGTAALMIASKYEEITPPDLNEFVYITDNTYKKKELVRMEQVLLSVLDFNMAAPTSSQFLHLFMSIHSVCDMTRNLALYATELSLLEIGPFLQYTPSIVAAAAYCLATYTINRSLWPDSLNAFTGYTMAEIVPCLTDLHKLSISAESCPQQAIRNKYRSSKYCRVSWITLPAVLPFL